MELSGKWGEGHGSLVRERNSRAGSQRHQSSELGSRRETSTVERYNGKVDLRSHGKETFWGQRSYAVLVAPQRVTTFAETNPIIRGTTDRERLHYKLSFALR